MSTPATKRIFDDGSNESRRVVLPWGQTIRMCISNVRQRLGRSALTFICIAVVVAFFASSIIYQGILARLMGSADLHVQAVLERAGVFVNDVDALVRQRDQRIWLMTLSVILCLVGITNTILMSVTERIREIGTLKCLGALGSFVVRLFLIENAFIGALASLLGAVLGCLLAILQLGAVFEFSLLSWDLCFSAIVPGLMQAVVLGTVLTLLASLYPTYVASRMRPVDAMRVEV
ncbi:MAG: FtsX-like permease family protein [Verrucomicrobia bacterium]|nr:FtsX-like permease family protein [Verrucomicrobiota bacterium]